MESFFSEATEAFVDVDDACLDEAPLALIGSIVEVEEGDFGILGVGKEGRKRRRIFVAAMNGVQMYTAILHPAPIASKD